MLALPRLASCLAALLLLAAPSRADTLKVPSQFPTIQDAVSAAVTGDTVLVAKGVYRENVGVATEGILLKGKGATIDGGYVGSCITVLAQDVTIDGFTLANGGAAAADGPPPTGGGIDSLGDGLEVRNCSILSSDNFGIRQVGTGRVEKCTIEGSPGTGILWDTGDGGATEVSVLAKNSVTRCGSGIVVSFGPVDVQKNEVVDNAVNGISFTIEGPVADVPSTFTGNRCTDNGNYGVVTQLDAGSPLVLILDNQIERNGFGLRVTGQGGVAHNTIARNRLGGAQLFGGGSTFVDNKLQDNGQLGLFVNSTVDPAATVSVLSNKITGNGGDGIQLAAGSVLIEKNTVKDNFGDGIEVASVTAAAREVRDNKVQNNRHDGIDNTAPLTLISDNVCKGNGGADLAGIGKGTGTTAPESEGNLAGDGTDLGSEQELELETTD